MNERLRTLVPIIMSATYPFFANRSMNFVGSFLNSVYTPLNRVAFVSSASLLVVFLFFAICHFFKLSYKALGISMAVCAFAFYYVIHPFPHIFFTFVQVIHNIPSIINLFVLVFLPLIVGMVLNKQRQRTRLRAPLL